MADIVTIDEKTILEIIGDYYGVPSMYVCLVTDYKFVRQGDDKVRKDYIYGIIHIYETKTVQPEKADSQKEIAKHVTTHSDRYCKGEMGKIRPTTEIFRNHNEDGSRTWDEIRYSCPTCGCSIGGYKSGNACDKCGTFYDWGDSEPKIEIKKEVVWS